MNLIIAINETSRGDVQYSVECPDYNGGSDKEKIVAMYVREALVVFLPKLADKIHGIIAHMPLPNKPDKS